MREEEKRKKRRGKKGDKTHHIAWPRDAKHVPHTRHQPNRMAPRVTHHPLGQPRRPTRINNIRRVTTPKRHTLHPNRPSLPLLLRAAPPRLSLTSSQQGTPHQPIPIPLPPLPPQRMPRGQQPLCFSSPSLAPFLAPHLLLALPDQGPRRRPRRTRETARLDDQLAVRNGRLGPVEAARRRQDGLWARRLDALRQGVGREAAKDDGVEGAEAGDGEEADEHGGDHGHWCDSC